MPNRILFSVNERVEWDVKRNNVVTTYHGSVAFVVPPMHCPRRLMDKRCGNHRGLELHRMSDMVCVREDWSYIILTDNVDRRPYRWPPAHKLRQEKQQKEL